jgi:hypothetical protein
MSTGLTLWRTRQSHLVKDLCANHSLSVRHTVGTTKYAVQRLPDRVVSSFFFFWIQKESMRDTLEKVREGLKVQR